MATNDRLCEGVNPLTVLEGMRNRPSTIAPSTFIFNFVQRGCQFARVNSQRTGYVIDAQGNIEERSGRFFNVDLRVSKDFRFGERFRLSTYADLYNLFNTENLSFALRPELSAATNPASFLQPVSLFGPGFGPPVGRPFTAQFGFRFSF